MAKFVKGDVVVVPFPFSDLTQAKRRPALVVTALDGDFVSKNVASAKNQHPIRKEIKKTVTF